MTGSVEQTIADGALFMDFLQAWFDRLAPVSLTDLIEEAGGPEHLGIFCVDVINGFCHEGALQSERMRGIVAPIADLIQRAGELGVQAFVLPQDAHPPDSVEFASFPPHCIAGTQEAATVPELLDLPIASRFTMIPKRSISAAVRTDLPRWISDHPEVSHRIVVGDCTDLCTYQLAMYLKTDANARNAADPVIVPADCVDTYDLPVDVARDLGILAHPGDFFHAVFLYHMALNGVRVASGVR